MGIIMKLKRGTKQSPPLDARRMSLDVPGCSMPAEWWVDYLLELACLGKYAELLQCLIRIRNSDHLPLLQEVADERKKQLCQERRRFSGTLHTTRA